MLLSWFFTFIKSGLQLNPSLNIHWMQLGFFYLWNLSLIVYTTDRPRIHSRSRCHSAPHPLCFSSQMFTPFKSKMKSHLLVDVQSGIHPPTRYNLSELYSFHVSSIYSMSIINLLQSYLSSKAFLFLRVIMKFKWYIYLFASATASVYT